MIAMLLLPIAAGAMSPSLPDLTPRQRDVAELVAQRLTTKRIAARLGISHRRVQRLIKSLIPIVGADPEEDERVAIALWWHQHAA